MTSMEQLINIFKRCLDIVRKDGLSGEIALRHISYFIVIKLVEPLIGNKIDLEKECQENFNNDSQAEDLKDNLLKYSKFSNLKTLTMKDGFAILDMLWEHIFSVSSSLNKIFPKDQKFNITRDRTYLDLIKEISKIDNDVDHDILGAAYEETIKDVMTGKIFGQYFTPSDIKKIMINLLDPQINTDGTVPSCCDPTMGTGGFLTSYLTYLREQGKEKNIELDLDSIVTQNLIYGKDIVPFTYQLALSNLLISTGYIFNVDCGDSLNNPIMEKYDYVLANPPFGIKDLKYEDFKSSFKEQYIPIESNNSALLFLQAIICMLKIGGSASVLLPNGKEIYGKNKDSVLIRQYLLKTCKVHNVISLPGMFEYTGIETCIVHFTKVKEVTDVITIKFNKDKQICKMIDEYSTIFLKFTDIKSNTQNDIKIQDIINSGNFSFNYKDYTEKNINCDQNLTIVELREICKIITGKRVNSKKGKETGKYPLYYCSILGNLWLDEYDYTDESLIINKTNGSGKCMIYYGDKSGYSVGNTTIQFKSNDENVLTKYIYYYFKYNIHILESYFVGAQQKSITNEKLLSIKIPIPPIDTQLYIIEQCESRDKIIESLKKDIKNLENNSRITIQEILRIEKTETEQVTVKEEKPKKSVKLSNKNLLDMSEDELEKLTIDTLIEKAKEDLGKKIAKSRKTKANIISEIIECIEKMRSEDDD